MGVYPSANAPRTPRIPSWRKPSSGQESTSKWMFYGQAHLRVWGTWCDVVLSIAEIISDLFFYSSHSFCLLAWTLPVHLVTSSFPAYHHLTEFSTPFFGVCLFTTESLFCCSPNQTYLRCILVCQSPWMSSSRQTGPSGQSSLPVTMIGFAGPVGRLRTCFASWEPKFSSVPSITWFSECH